MRKLLSILLSLLMLTSLLPAALAEGIENSGVIADVSVNPTNNLPHDPDGTPAVFYQGNTVVKPGNAVGVRGEYLDQTWTATLSDGEKSAQVELLQQNRQSFKFIIPADFAEGAYTLTLAGEKPLTLTVNEPNVQWLQGDEGAVSTPGGWVRVQGECLSITEDAQHTLTLAAADGTVTTLTAEKVYDAYSVQFAIPELPLGDYAAAYSNGYAQQDAGTLTISKGPKGNFPYADKVYNMVTKYKLDNTGVKDCTAMVNVVLGHLGNTGGGVAYFPQGRYLFSGTINVPHGVTIRGDGAEFTQFFWRNTWRTTKKYESGAHDYVQQSAPSAFYFPSGTAAIEDIEVAAGYIGTLFQGHMHAAVPGNNRIENVRVNQNAYFGTSDGWHADYWASIEEQFRKDAPRMLALYGDNNKVINCEFKTSHNMVIVGNNSSTHYLLVQNCTFDPVENAWANWNGIFQGIIEDCTFTDTTFAYRGDNIYTARTKILDAISGDNRESFTTDMGGGVKNFQGTVGVGEDGLRYTFPDSVNVPSYVDNSLAGRRQPKLVILEGTGAGQWRYITGYEGNAVIISEPFDVTPDENSRVTLSAMPSNWYFVDMTVDNGGMFQFYVGQNNSVIDGMKVTRSSGIKLYGQQTYSTVGMNWYNSVVNCDFSQGNHYHVNGYMDYWSANKLSEVSTSIRLPGGSFISAVATPCGGNQPTYSLCPTIRGNTLTNNCLIYLFSGDEGAMVDPIVDSNFSYNTRCGIYIEGAPGNLLLNNNTTQNVPAAIERFPYDATQYRPQFE